MPQPRLYVPASLNEHAKIELDAERAHYLGRVLRMKPGDALTLFNGDGDEYAATLGSLGRNSAALELKEKRDADVESPLQVRLVQGIARGERMDFVVQKATELGVREIVPVLTERAVVRLSDSRAERRQAHWRKIAVAACEQCGRNVIPEIVTPMTLTQHLDRAKDTALRIALVPEARSSLREAGYAEGLLEVLVGPEGGLAPAEIDAVAASGYRSCTIGPRILRTETAGIATLVAAQVLWGDLT